MARKKEPGPPEDAEPQLREPREQAAAKIETRIAAGNELIASAPNPGSVRQESQVEEFEHQVRMWHDYNVALMRSLFTGDKIATEYDWSPSFVFAREHDPILDLLDAIERTKRRIRSLESIRGRLEIYQAPQAQPQTAALAKTMSPSSTRVFVVHGHEEAPRETVARFLTQLGLEPIILHEQANAGQTLIEKFERNAEVAFAVVLFTPDDVGASKRTMDGAREDKDELGALQPRVRQNVLLELGYFVGKRGRSNACVLKVGSVELPTDMLGVVWVPMETGTGWKLELARELKQAGFSIDMNKAL